MDGLIDRWRGIEFEKACWIRGEFVGKKGALFHFTGLSV